jgi:hypothetical protein
MAHSMRRHSGSEGTCPWSQPRLIDNVAGHPSIFYLALEPCGLISENKLVTNACRGDGGQGEPGGTRAMGVCEPGQGGNAAAISNTFMCLGEPPRLSPAPAMLMWRGEGDSLKSW